MKHQSVLIGTRSLPNELWYAMEELRRGQDLFRSPFFSPEFIRVISNVREDLHIFLGESSQGLAYYCPIHMSRGQTARGIGGTFSDRNGIISAPGVNYGITDLCEDNDIRKFISNGYVAPTLPTSESFQIALNNETDIGTDFDTYFEGQKKLYPSHFKRLGRLRRKLEKDFTEVEFRFDDQCENTFEALIAMKREQYVRTGRHDVLQPSWVQNMLSELRNLKSRDLQLRMASLFLDGKLVAAELNLQSHETLHGWLVAFDTEYGKYSPGNLLTQFILENMSAHGLRYYDSGSGGDYYKKYVTNLQSPIGIGTLHSEGSKLSPRRILGSVWGYAENAAPHKIANALQRSRRRSEQILATEVDNLGRIKGFYNALNVEI